MRANPAVVRRMPPVLHVPLAKLMGGGAQQLLAEQRRPRVDQRHGVLELIAKTKGAAGLVKACARPQAARQGLVEQPAVGENIEGWIWRFDVNRGECVIPMTPDRLEGLAT